MAYQVLARKWRPRNFAQLVGQEHVIRALANAFANGRLHHAYLLTGTRGVGKTTIARIMAKALNCETGVTAEPCGTCSACTQIDAGRFVDLLEIDAASNTGIDNIREVLDNAQYAPTAGRFKVYIIDEVHMLSKSAFNAMLKTLEEPPGHVKFILATTDPQKMPITVLSRCLQFSLRQMTPQQVAGHLQKVLDAEQLPFEASALPLLGHAANGSMRDALSLLDQAIAYGAGKVEEAGVRAMLGAVDQSYLFDILAALIAKDGLRLMQAADGIAARGLSYEAALHELAHVLHQIALVQAVPGALGDELPQRADIEAVAAALAPEDAQLYYQIALHGRRDLPLAPDEYAGFSMTLLRMLAFAPAEPGQVSRANSPAAPGQVSRASSSVEPGPTTRPSSPTDAGLAARVASPTATISSAGTASAAAQPMQATAEATPATAQAAVPAPQAAAVQVPRPAPTPVVAASKPVPLPQPAVTEPAAYAAPGNAPIPPWQDEAPAVIDAAELALQSFGVASSPAIESEPAAPAIPAGPPPEFDGDWRSLVVQLKLGAAGMLAQHAELVDYRPGHFELRVSAEHKAVATRDYQDKLRAVLAEYYGRDINVNVTLGESTGDTPAAIATRERAARQAAAVDAIQNDPFVQAMVRDFGATVVPDTIRPL
ncbi:DNA polymerase III subunit gamma/tau [Chitinolyticbacter meiyuanensis]|uniref:DNA polymerase III subunit gamma/tau n=1 Tax=Chitinolyticbacter meiyuanensis TaxID=682798 RepID=UPI0011E5A8BD|nr:DNA polymerase III subunit gamma/tau [Chitinolyticbacter meiyuanensis]